MNSELTDDLYRAIWDACYAHDGDEDNATCVANIIAGTSYLSDAVTVREAAAERRGAVNALRDAADTAERLRADTYLARVYRDRADRIEAGDA